MKALNKFMSPAGEITIFSATAKADAAEFWPAMGQHFASKDVFNAFGEPMFDHDAMIWVLAFINDRLVGFSALDLDHLDKGDVLFTFSYVLPDFRLINVYGRMFDARVKLVERDTDAKRIKAVCTKESEPMFEKHGFEKGPVRGRYTTYCKNIVRKAKAA